MKVEHDSKICTGHGRCYELAPEVFDADEFGHGVVKVVSVPAGLEEKVRLAVENCPEAAILLRPDK